MSPSHHLSQEQLHHSLSPIYPAIGPPSFASYSRTFPQIECSLECLLTETCAHRGTTWWFTNAGRCTSRVTVDMLPDVALLEIFDCYVTQAREEGRDDERWLQIQAWHTLVHVCQKWRTIVLGSPRRLDLQLFCKDTTPVEETLAVWPPLPIVIAQYEPLNRWMYNIIVALGHNDRVCEIDLTVTDFELEEVLAAMQQPFSALKDLYISLWEDDDFGWEVGDEIDETPPVVPETFLGGSAPRLQYLFLHNIPFPGLSKLLLSTTGLVSLYLFDIPHSGYISPEAMASCLSTLTRLERLAIAFKSPLSRPARETRPPHSPTRFVLLALTDFRFQGVSEYLEDLMSPIDAPLLDTFDIRFFHQLIFDTPQLTQFIARTPNTQPPVEARIAFSDRDVVVTCPGTFSRSFSLGLSCCRQSDWRLSSVAQFCNSSFPEAFIPTVEHLYIYERKNFTLSYRPDDIEDSQWLEVLHPFTAVKYLYLSRKFISHIAPALQELVGEVLPSLLGLFLEDLHPSGSVHGAIGEFVAVRQLTGHPIAISRWDRNLWD